MSSGVLPEACPPSPLVYLRQGVLIKKNKAVLEGTAFLFIWGVNRSED